MLILCILLLIASVITNIYLTKKLFLKVQFSYQEHEKKEEQYNSRLNKLKQQIEELEEKQRVDLQKIGKGQCELTRIENLIPEKMQQLSIIKDGIAMAKENYEKEVSIAKLDIDKQFAEHKRYF